MGNPADGGGLARRPAQGVVPRIYVAEIERRKTKYCPRLPFPDTKNMITINRTSYLICVSGILSLSVTAAWFWHPGKYIADDAYFYLVIARNLAIHGVESFNQIVATNGSHPMWQYLLALWATSIAAWHVLWINNPIYIVPLAAAFFSLGLVNLLLVARRIGASYVVILSAPYLFLALFGHLGSEAHLHFAALTLLLAVCVHGEPRNFSYPIVLGFVAAMLALTRLDSIFVGVAAIGFCCWRAEACELRKLGRVRSILIGLASMALFMAPYLVRNLLVYDGLMPVSGWMKSSFPNFFLKWLDINGLSTGWMGYAILWGWVPIILGISTSLAAIRESSPFARVLVPMTLGVSAQALYVVCFTRSNTLWVWYYVDSVVLGTFAVAWGLRRALFLRSSHTAMGYFVAVAVATTLVVGWLRGDRPPTPTSFEQEEFAKSLPDGETIFVSDWPGATAYYSKARVIAADFLTLNRNIYKEMRGSPNALCFLEKMTEDRGHPIRWIVITGNYWLTHSEDGRVIEYNDPRKYPEQVPIGRAILDEPKVLGPSGSLVWKVGDGWCQTGAASYE